VIDGPPQDPEDHDPVGPRARAAAGFIGAGIILGAAAVICLACRAIVVQQAIAMALPAALLVIGGVILGSPPDVETGRRLGFLTGFQIGSLVSRLRSLFRRRGNGD
jgi:heme A synthase